MVLPVVAINTAFVVGLWAFGLRFRLSPLHFYVVVGRLTRAMLDIPEYEPRRSISWLGRLVSFELRSASTRIDELDREHYQLLVARDLVINGILGVAMNNLFFLSVILFDWI